MSSHVIDFTHLTLSTGHGSGGNLISKSTSLHKLRLLQSLTSRYLAQYFHSVCQHQAGTPFSAVMATKYESLAGRYIRYKDGTEKLIAWLVSTASGCCDIVRLVSSLESPKSTHSAASGEAIEVKVTELVPLAKAILNSEATAKIPARILEITRDIIIDLTKCANEYAAKSIRQTGRLADKDQSYQHFIGVLEQILDCFMSSTTPSSHGEPARSG